MLRTWKLLEPRERDVSKPKRSLTSMLLFLVIVCACQLPTMSNTSTPQESAPENDTRAWTEHVVPGAMGCSLWGGITSSADGTKLVAGAVGRIYTSEDSGVTWMDRTNPGGVFGTVTSSADGTRLAAIGGTVTNDYPWPRIRGCIYTSTDGGATWTERTSAGDRKWSCITSSADGTRLVAGVWTTVCKHPWPSPPGYIYTSTDSGATWTERRSAGSRNWGSITSSADGIKLAALVYPDHDGSASYPGYVYTSTDGGVTWTERKTVWDWYGIKSSADGTTLAAVSNGYIQISTDSGVTWTWIQPSAERRNWSGIAISADGAKLAAVVKGGYIYTSTDRGATWTERTSAGYGTWSCIASSADGTSLATAEWDGCVSVSLDGGATWTERTSAGYRDWGGITSSADGTRLAAAARGGYIYTSTDGGMTWTERTSAGYRDWGSIASSADGTRLAAVLCTSTNEYPWPRPPDTSIPPQMAGQPGRSEPPRVTEVGAASPVLRTGPGLPRLRR